MQGIESWCPTRTSSPALADPLQERDFWPLQAKLFSDEFAPYVSCLVALGAPPAAACAWLRGLETRDLCSDHSLAWRIGTCCSLAEVGPFAPGFYQCHRCLSRNVVTAQIYKETAAKGMRQVAGISRGPDASKASLKLLAWQAKHPGVTAKTLGTQRKRRRASVQGSRTIPARRSSLIGSSSWQDRWKVSPNSPVSSSVRLCLVSSVDRDFLSCSRSVPSTRECETP